MKLFNKSFRGVGSIFGPAGPYVDALEHQKREFPHTHTVLWLDKPIRNAQDADDFVCAEIPEDDACCDAVKRFIVHTPCGPGCWEGKREGCAAGFPFDFTNETVWQNDAYPLHRRRSPADGGHTFILDGQTIDNR